VQETCRERKRHSLEGPADLADSVARAASGYDSCLCFDAKRLIDPDWDREHEQHTSCAVWQPPRAHAEDAVANPSPNPSHELTVGRTSVTRPPSVSSRPGMATGGATAAVPGCVFSYIRIYPWPTCEWCSCAAHASEFSTTSCSVVLWWAAIGEAGTHGRTELKRPTRYSAEQASGCQIGSALHGQSVPQESCRDV